MIDLDEFVKCKNDIKYFILKYCDLCDDKHNERIIDELINNRFNFMTFMKGYYPDDVLMGFYLHDFLFMIDKNTLLIKYSFSGCDLLKRLFFNKMYKVLDFFIDELKPEIEIERLKIRNKNNGCYIRFDTVKNNFPLGSNYKNNFPLGSNYNNIYINEYDNDKLNKFIFSIIPALTSVKNTTFNIQSRFEQKDNDLMLFINNNDLFNKISLNWTDFNYKNDFKRKLISNIGIESFKREYELYDIDIIKQRKLKLMELNGY